MVARSLKQGVSRKLAVGGHESAPSFVHQLLKSRRPVARRPHFSRLQVVSPDQPERVPKPGTADCSKPGWWDQGVSPHFCDTRKSPFI